MSYIKRASSILANLSSRPRASTFHTDGFLGAQDHLTAASRSCVPDTVIMVDPTFEHSSDVHASRHLLHLAATHTSVSMVTWFTNATFHDVGAHSTVATTPVVDQLAPPPGSLVVEVARAIRGEGLQQFGLIVTQPPSGLAEAISDATPFLEETFECRVSTHTC